MDLKPRESKEVIIESPVPLEEIKGAMVEVGWYCAGCNHDHSMITKVNPLNMQVGIACPCCTPWWMKLRNRLFS